MWEEYESSKQVVKMEGRGTGSLLFMMRLFIPTVGGRFRTLCSALSIFSSNESKGAKHLGRVEENGGGEREGF
jgi:hypothetical protein